MLNTIEKALLLQELDLLRFASADHLMLLAEAGREVVFRKGDAIYRAGDPPSTFYLLLRGRAAIGGADGPVVEKTALDLRSCLRNVERPAGCICIEDCTALAFETPDLLDLLASEPELSLAMLKHFVSE
ncbi:MAG: Cyclic nucleotide-binding domain [Acidobacteria bacterium]|jgi:CRP-like cAMP-binding protein|nr:Cyclic nucleotide-binding domain [Acidobacteriota bacterium]